MTDKEKKKKQKIESKLVKAILSCSELGKMKLKVNTLENENEVLKLTIKDELYNAFINKLNEPAEIERLRAENKRLHQKNKLLREMLKEDNSSKKRRKK